MLVFSRTVSGRDQATWWAPEKLHSRRPHMASRPHRDAAPLAAGGGTSGQGAAVQSKPEPGALAAHAGLSAAPSVEARPGRRAANMTPPATQRRRTMATAPASAWLANT